MKPTRIGSLDALRALAAVAVLLFHNSIVTGAGATGFSQRLAEIGQAGVQVFFCLSGYLIAGPFVRQIVDGSTPPAISGYVLRRTARILPGYWAAITIMWCKDSPHTGFASLVREWAFWPDPRYMDIFPLRWTLQVELAFYLTVPLITWLVTRITARRLRPSEMLCCLGGVWLIGAVAALVSTPAASAPLRIGARAVVDAALFTPGIALAVLQTSAATLQ